MAFTAISHSSDDDDPKSVPDMLEIMGPQAADQAVRHALSACWMTLPKGKKTVEHVEAEFRRLVERAIKDLREDAKAFEIEEKSG